MAESNLNFAKIVANPTPYGWSQAYSAGKLFAVISLEKEPEVEEKDYLNVVGKEILNTLEQEFFTLETKDLESIKQAVSTTLQKVPQNVSLSFVAGSIVGNVLYLYILGNGKADIKRDGTLGTLLEASDQANDSIKEASGFLQDADVLILQTRKFSEVISDSTLLEFLENSTITDASENLAPLIHEKENPTASAVIVNYKEQTKVEEFAPEEKSQEQVHQEPISQQDQSENKTGYFATENGQPKTTLLTKLSSPFSILKRLRIPSISGLSQPRKVILLIVVVIVILFVGSVFLALQKQGVEKVQSQFASIYPQALKKYEEGQSLMDLNQTLAKDSFQQAKKILNDGKSTLPKDSSQESKVIELLAKIDTALGSSAISQSVNAAGVNLSESPYLLVQTKENALDFTKDDKNTYLVDASELASIVNGQTSSKTLFENDKDWKDVGGIAVYNTNLYLVDKDKNQILKFVNTGSEYQKSNYFSESVTPDFSKAVSIAIDNNVYVLFSDGNVVKYFKGQAQDFSLKGLDKPLSNPIKIYANTDFDNIYVLDKGNSRVVVFDKTGSFKAQYLAGVVKNASDFEVLEADKKVLILNNNKIFQIDLK
ncbi:MAG: hypothetical protein UR81_C0008G0013 [Candidatus Levybacteria bacterium GW2011_GWB1_35_5]|nr:MAG: hypothetical protein UR81_C0008G0013 [Candidatus Levybacteria bacterium GW2011_GWB1_35_5]